MTDFTESRPPSPDEEPFAVANIERMVIEFYGRVREDTLLGPIFAGRIHDWEPHLDRMALFWRAVLRGERVFITSPRGGPPALHRSIDGLTASHFERWLSLFGGVADTIYEPAAAQEAKEAALGIAENLSRHLTIQR